jgi:hypothetical protein
MSLDFTAEVVVLTPEVRAAALAIGKPTALTRVMARQARNDLRAHFAQRHRENPNKLGGARSGFWLQVRGSVQQPVLLGKTSAVVVVEDPRLAQRVYGGVIKPKRAKVLTIPVHPQAYNRRARTIEGLVYIPMSRGETVGLLVMPASGGGLGEVYYALRKSVRQRADFKALPNFGWLQSRVVARAESWLRRELERRRR